MEKEEKSVNELKVFQNSEFGELGILLIDGKEYFPATQCAKIIGHQNPARAVRRYCKGVTKMVTLQMAAHKKSTTFQKVTCTA